MDSDSISLKKTLVKPDANLIKGLEIEEVDSLDDKLFKTVFLDGGDNDKFEDFKELNNHISQYEILSSNQLKVVRSDKK